MRRGALPRISQGGRSRGGGGGPAPELRPPRGLSAEAGGTSDSRDLVVQAREQPAEDRGLRGGVVRVARLPEGPGRRADEDERAAAPRGEATEEAARGQERRGQVRAQRRLPARERQLP